MLPLHIDKAFFSIMQNKTDKGTLLVPKSLPVANSNSVCRLFSARKKKYDVSSSETYSLTLHLTGADSTCSLFKAVTT